MVHLQNHMVYSQGAFDRGQRCSKKYGPVFEVLFDFDYDPWFDHNYLITWLSEIEIWRRSLVLRLIEYPRKVYSLNKWSKEIHFQAIILYIVL